MGTQDQAGLSSQMAEAEAVQLKEEGNRFFQEQDYKAAARSYGQALKLTKDKALLATLYRNRAACGLKTVWGWGYEGWGCWRLGCLPHCMAQDPSPGTLSSELSSSIAFLAAL